jgi:hypothetical protein
MADVHFFCSFRADPYSRKVKKRSHRHSKPVINKVHARVLIGEASAIGV